MSTPKSLDLPDGVRRTTIHTSRGTFAALGAVPVSGVCERDTALLVPGYTGSKEDFLAILDLLADGGRQVIAIDMRGQFESPGAQENDGYLPSALAADVAAVIYATGAKHLLGHSYGGLVAREAVLAGVRGVSFTLMSSGPGALTGARAKEVRTMLTALGVRDGTMPDRSALAAGISQLWQAYLEPQAVTAGVPAPIVAFLAERMLSNDPYGLVLMAQHMLAAPDRTAELARLGQLPTLVIYGENDNSWSPAAQEIMARRLGACRVCIPGAVHSPAVEAPATTASALTDFWDEAETLAAMHAAITTGRPLSPRSGALGGFARGVFGGFSGVRWWRGRPRGGGGLRRRRLLGSAGGSRTSRTTGWGGAGTPRRGRRRAGPRASAHPQPRTPARCPRPGSGAWPAIQRCATR